MPNSKPLDTKEYLNSKPVSDWLYQNLNTPDLPISRTIFTSQSFYESFWARCSHAIVILDEQGAIIDGNPAFYDLIATTPSEASDHTVYDLIGPKHFRADVSNIESVIKGKVYSFETDDVIKKRFDAREMIRVRVLCCRIPSALDQNFEYIIAHIYELDSNYIYNISETASSTISEKSWGSLMKELVFQRWFIYCILAFFSLLVIMASLTGNLAPLLDRVFDSVNKQEQTMSKSPQQ